MAYTGARVTIPIGTVGFTNIQNMSKTPMQGAIQAEGLEFIEGSVQRESGNVQHIPIPTGYSIVDAIEFHPTPNAQHLVMYGLESGGNAAIFRSINDLTSVTLKTGLTFSQTGFQFLVGGSESLGRLPKLFLFNGASPVQVLEGAEAATTDISKPPADWTGTNQPFFGIMHRNCVWSGGNMNDPHRIYKSSPADHEDYTTEIFSISVFPGEGEGLSGGYSLNGRLFLFKRPHGIYWVDDTSINKADWGIKKLVDTIGLANPNALCETESDLVFLDPSPAVYSLASVQEFGDVRPRSLLDEYGVDQWLKNNMQKVNAPWDLYTVPKIIWHTDKRNVILSFLKSEGVYGKLFLDYRFSPVKVGYSFRDPILTSVMATGLDGIPRHTYGSTEWLFAGDQIARTAASIDGGPWTSKYQIPHLSAGTFDPSLTGQRISLEWLTIESTMFTAQTIMVDVFLDGVYKYTLNYTFPVTLEGFILDVDKLDEGKLGGMVSYTRTKRLRGTCERFSFIFYTEHPSQNFVLNDVLLSFRPNAIRVRRKP